LDSYLSIFFTCSTDPCFLVLFACPIIYKADTDKLKILKENKAKSGIYCFRNLKNGQKYVGSSADLAKRFYNYFNLKYLIKNSMYINRALQKYGYSNFSLEI